MKQFPALFVAAAALVAAGCATKTETIYETRRVEVPVYETVPVPETLLEACKVDLSALESNSDLERVLAEAIVELRRCTEDKDAIRALE